MSHLKSLMGLVDKQAQLELDNVGLFAQTALFVREVLADPQKVKEFIKQMETLGVKMSPDLRKAAGINLTEKEKSKLGQSNMLLPMMRAIFHSKEGKLRSFENYAYPMTQLLKDEMRMRWTASGLSRSSRKPTIWPQSRLKSSVGRMPVPSAMWMKQ